MLSNQYNTKKSLSKTIQETSHMGSTTDQCCGIFPLIYTTTHWRAHHILQTNTATHEHTKYFKLSQFSAPNGPSSPFPPLCHVLFSHRSSALPLKEKNDDTPHYNTTRSTFLLHPLVMPPILLHFLHFLPNKTPINTLLFPAQSSSLL